MDVTKCYLFRIRSFCDIRAIEESMNLRCVRRVFGLNVSCGQTRVTRVFSSVTTWGYPDNWHQGEESKRRYLNIMPKLRSERPRNGGAILGSARDFSLLQRVEIDSETQPASYILDNGVSFPEIKRPGRGADLSSPNSAEVTIPSRPRLTSLWIFIAWWLIKNRNNFN
jgi:hypothetical protein